MKRLALFTALCASLTFSYTYTAWTSMTGAKTFAVNPFFYAGFDDISGISTDLVAGYGFSDNLDIFANLATLSPIKDMSWGGSWVMPRYALAENHIVALQVGHDGDFLSLTPQYHTFKDADNYALECNLALSLSSEDFAYGTAWATLGGVYKLVPDIFYPYLEINPSVDYGGGESAIDFTLSPGAWYAIKDTPHQFSLSIPVSGIKDGDISLGLNLWYWWSFGGTEDAPASE